MSRSYLGIVTEVPNVLEVFTKCMTKYGIKRGKLDRAWSKRFLTGLSSQRVGPEMTFASQVEDSLGGKGT